VKIIKDKSKKLTQVLKNEQC